MQSTRSREVIGTKDIDRFADLVGKGLQCWIEAGTLYVTMIDADPTVRDRILERHPMLAPNILARFEQIGRRQVHPRLLISDGPGFRKLRAMPYSVQDECLASPVKFYNTGGKHRLVHVKDMSREVAEQVFAENHVRNQTEQKAYIEAKRAIAEPVEEEMQSTPWQVRRNRLYVEKPCEMTRQELAAILASMS